MNILSKTAITMSCMALVLLFAGTPVKASITGNAEAVFAADSTKIYEVVDEMPEIKGGIQEIYKNIDYPKVAIAGNVEGRVFVKFVVNEQGKVENPTVLKDIGAGCGDAAVKGLKKVEFTPGKLNGQAVKVYYTLPITFEIQN